MKSIAKFIILSIGLALFNPISSHAFTVNGYGTCQNPHPSTNQKIYAYGFGLSDIARTYEIEIVADEKEADFSILLMDNFKRANLRLIKDNEDAAMRICKAVAKSENHQLVNIDLVESANKNAIKIYLSPDAEDPDYRLFVDNANYTNEEAAAFFVVLWQARRDKLKSD